MSETALGRMTKKSPVGAFASFGNSFPFKLGGWLNAVIPILIVPYYSTIGGWVIKYLAEYLKGNVQEVAQDGYFTGFITDSFQTELWFLVFAALIFIIILGGVRNGVERMSKIMMPILVLLAIVVTNVFPNTGVTLPFISYGGTASLFLLAELGIVFNISSQIRLER